MTMTLLIIDGWELSRSRAPRLRFGPTAGISHNIEVQP